MAEPVAAPARSDAPVPVLSVRELTKQYVVRGRAVHAVSGVSFDVMPGETVGLVGESGCGKSTLGRAILQLPPPTSGQVRFEGHDLCALRGEPLRRLRPKLQMVFQDPISSLNPRRRVVDIVASPLRLHAGLSASEREAAVEAMLEAVGLDPRAFGPMRPHELSGGQCQRVSIARALILQPTMLVCDEAVSSLDVSVQAQILNLLEDTKARFRLSVLFIAHDLAVVKNVADRIAVMYLGRLCEIAPAEALYARPRHPYTRALIASIPRPDPCARDRPAALLEGDLPSPSDPPSGCRFRTRCPNVQDRCARETPTITEVGERHLVACHFPLAAD